MAGRLGRARSGGGAAGGAYPAAAERARVEAEIRRAAGDPRVPDFFVVGHAKSGTTALHQMLKQHPQIFMPDFKEPRYFATDMPSTFRARPSGRLRKSYEDYLALFEDAAPGQRVGESSVDYIWSQTAPELLALARPDARIVTIFREPASLVRSIHLELLQLGLENHKSLRKALALEPERKAGRGLPRRGVASFPHVLVYTERVRYVQQLRRYRELFGEERVLVVIYDDYRRENEATLRRLQRFLEVEHAGPVVTREANPTVRLRSPRMRVLARRAASSPSPGARAVRKLATTLAPPGVSRASAIALRDRVLYARPRPPDERVTAQLRERFRPEVEAFGEYLGRDLVALWGYDRPDQAQ